MILMLIEHGRPSGAIFTLCAMEPPIKPGETWRMTIIGHPTPQGDLTAAPIMRRDESGVAVPVIGRGGRPVVKLRHSNTKSLTPWRNDVAKEAIAAGWPGLGVAALDEAVVVRLTFFFVRPDNHFGTGRNADVLKDSSPLYPERTGGDLDKLTRAVLDALTGLVWKDDKRVVTLHPRRRYAAQERVEVAVRRPLARTVGELRRLRDVNPLLAEAVGRELQLDLFAAVKDPRPGEAREETTSVAVPSLVP